MKKSELTLQESSNKGLFFSVKTSFCFPRERESKVTRAYKQCCRRFACARDAGKTHPEKNTPTHTYTHTYNCRMHRFSLHKAYLIRFKSRAEKRERERATS